MNEGYAICIDLHLSEGAKGKWTLFSCCIKRSHNTNPSSWRNLLGPDQETFRVIISEESPLQHCIKEFKYSSLSGNKFTEKFWASVIKAAVISDWSVYHLMGEKLTASFKLKTFWSVMSMMHLHHCLEANRYTLLLLPCSSLLLSMSDVGKVKRYLHCLVPAC